MHRLLQYGESMDAWTAIFAALLAVLIASGLFVYAVFKLVRGYSIESRLVALARTLGLSRAVENPVLSPTALAWEASAVMNPGAVEAGGRTHLFYRAVGSDGVSRIGYASSTDGRNFDTRSKNPVFALPDSCLDHRRRAYIKYSYPHLYGSGGSFAGTEDPRAVVIDGRLYLSFQAFSDWGSLRVGVTSISVDDLLAQRWVWSSPTYLSPPNQVHKNWVLFPKKVNDSYALLHGFESGNRNRPNIAYVKTLSEGAEPYIESDARFRDEEDPSAWDTRVRGAGPPPIETDQGWLLLYHATDKKEPHKYKLGALLLDKQDPSKVIKRSPGPVLAPDATYENEGAKSGVVYACGAVVKGDTLSVYYGGADSVVCAAETSLSKLLGRLGTV